MARPLGARTPAPRAGTPLSDPAAAVAGDPEDYGANPAAGAADASAAAGFHPKGGAHKARLEKGGPADRGNKPPAPPDDDPEAPPAAERAAALDVTAAVAPARKPSPPPSPPPQHQQPPVAAVGAGGVQVESLPRANMCLPWRRGLCRWQRTKHNPWAMPQKAAHGPNFNLPNRPHRGGFKVHHREDVTIGHVIPR